MDGDVREGVDKGVRALRVKDGGSALAAVEKRFLNEAKGAGFGC